MTGITDTQAVTLLMQLREARAELAEQASALAVLVASVDELKASVDELNDRVVKIRQALLYAIDAETEPVKECAP